MANINVKDTMILEGNIIPDSNNARSLGSGSVNWVSVHTNDLYVTNNVVTDLIPNVDGVRDLGSSSKKWKDAYVTDLFATGSSTLSGNVSISGTISSDLLPDTSSPRDLGSASNRWKDAYVTDLYSSGSSTLGGSVNVSGTINSNLIPSGTRNIGSSGTPWNAIYGNFAIAGTQVRTNTGSTSTPGYAFDSDTDTGMFVYNSGGIKAPAIVTDGSIQNILDGDKVFENLGSTTSVAYLAGLSPGGGSAVVSLNGTQLASITFTALSTRIFMIGHVYSGYSNVDTGLYAGVRLGSTAYFSEASLAYVKASEPGANLTVMAFAETIPGTQYTVRLRAGKDVNSGVTNAQGTVMVLT